jgi:molybdate transport system ATP-binding protein
MSVQAKQQMQEMQEKRGLDARLVVRRDRFDLDLDLQVAPGSVVALLGPNGAGKSTALRALAGLVRMPEGHVRLGDRLLDADGRTTPTDQRGVGMVFQDYLLFPHLSAADNVAFGLRSRGTPRRAAHQTAVEWLDRVGLAGFERVKPHALSGGQSQRVALARALATAPDLLLLDEPLAALDAGTRVEVRTGLRRHLRDYPGCTVLVTHDPLDAMVLADRLVVVEEGRVVQQGTPAEVARAPRTDYVARLVGLNLFDGVAGSSPNTVELDGGGALQVAHPVKGQVFVAFSPSAVSLHTRRPEGSARNVWHGHIDSLEQHADVVRVSVVGVAGPPPVLADVTTGAVAELGLDVGRDVWVSVKATELRHYPR